MKLKVVLVIIALVAVGLGIALYNNNQKAEKEHNDAVEAMGQLSNGWSSTSRQLEEQVQKNMSLQTDYSNEIAAASGLSNNLVQATQTIKDRDAALKAAQEEKAQNEKRIAELESDKQQLDAQTVALTNQISAKNGEITSIQKKLESSEGDRAFLEKELQRLMAEKAELEQKFNNLAVLKDQVRKLKEEMDLARRLEWIREGVYAVQDQKGAQRLMQGPLAANTKPAPSTNTYDLNVEVKTDGSVQIIQPIQPAPAPGDVAPSK